MKKVSGTLNTPKAIWVVLVDDTDEPHPLLVEGSGGGQEGVVLGSIGHTS